MGERTKVTEERLREAGRLAAQCAMRRIEEEAGAPSCIALECLYDSRVAQSTGSSTELITIRTELVFVWKASMDGRSRSVQTTVRCDKALYGHALVLTKDWHHWLVLTACQNALSKIGCLPWMQSEEKGDAKFLSLACPRPITGPTRQIIILERGYRREYVLCAPTADKNLWYGHPGSGRGDALNTSAPFLPQDLKLVDLRRKWETNSHPQKRLRGRIPRRGQIGAAVKAKPYAYSHIVSIAKWLALAENCTTTSMSEVANQCGLEIDPWEWCGFDPEIVVLWNAVNEDDTEELRYSTKLVKLLIKDLQ